MYNVVDKTYKALVQHVLRHGFLYNDPKRVGTVLRQVPDARFEHDMSNGFPLLTSKHVSWKLIAHELIWMLSGSTNIGYLQAKGVHIWDQDALGFGKSGLQVGRIYGAQWRSWRAVNHVSSTGHKTTTEVDQIAALIANMKDNSAFLSRRLLVTAWQPGELDNMALPPCHWSFEVMPDKLGGFALKWRQRSTDVFLGLPFDIASYAFLGLILEKYTGRKFNKLIGDLSNVHIYNQHMDAIRLQQSRVLNKTGPKVRLVLPDNLDDLNIDCFNVEEYKPHGAIKAPLITHDRHANS